MLAKVVSVICTLLAMWSLAQQVQYGRDRQSDKFDLFCYRQPTTTEHFTTLLNISYTRPLGSPPLRYSYVPNDDCDMLLYVPTPDQGLSTEILKNAKIVCTDITDREYKAHITTKIFVPVDNWPNISIIPREWGFLSTLLTEIKLRTPKSLTRVTCHYYIPVNDAPLEGKLTYNFDVQACPANHYGSMCQSQCECHNGGSCHSFNGACYCAPGWRGDTCLQEFKEAAIVLSPGLDNLRISDGLNMSCDGYHVTVASREWYFNGQYLHGEMEHYIPFISDVQLGDITVTTGNYTCKIKDDNSEEYEAIIVIQPENCPPSKHGVLCELLCDCPENSTCERFDGCYCYAGVTGKHCDEVCPNGLFGRNCTEICTCQNNGACDEITGHCICAQGWTGEYCQEKLTEMTNIYIAVGASAAVLLAAIAFIIVCIRVTRYEDKTNVTFTSASDRVRLLENIANASITGQSEKTDGSILVNDLRKWLIKGCDLAVGNLVGVGGFGSVYKAKYTHSMGPQMTVAVKMLSGRSSSVEERALLSEAYHHIRLGFHANIVNIHGIVVDDGPLKMVVEYAVGGDLLSFLTDLQSRQKSKRPTVSRALFTHSVFLTDIAVDVCRGMQYLHDKHVLHRDIAARNVLIYGEGRAGKLCDFGLARDVYTYVYKKKLKKDSCDRLPLRWMAPETLDGDFVYSKDSDIWGYGVLLWEISSLGRLPYENIADEHILPMLKLGKRLPRMPGCPRELYTVMHACWDRDNKRRPNPSDIIGCLTNLKHQKKGFFFDPIISGTTRDVKYANRRDVNYANRATSAMVNKAFEHNISHDAPYQIKMTNSCM